MVESGGGLAEFSREMSYEWLLYSSDYQEVLDAALDELNTCAYNKQDRAVVQKVIEEIVGIHEIQRGVPFRQAVLNPSGYKFVCSMIERKKLKVKLPLPLVRS